MAGKCPRKGSQKGSQKENDKRRIRNRNTDFDELDLRDEILELKRDMAVLRKERDGLMIRLRKCEEEARRKDRQIEQLMDPTQNSEIRRLLSVKGAALLMNLKDQNNALLQMIMNKDHQIRRLLSEIKTAKLYCKSSKTEPYRAEITRLKLMLMQSQEALKDAAGTPPASAVCVHGHSSSSSDRTSPRELEELRFTIQSLETHMKYSKELIGKKNKEITTLNQQLQNIINGRHCQTIHEADWHGPADFIKFDSARRCTSASVLELFQSPTSDSVKSSNITPEQKTPRRRSMPVLMENTNQLVPENFLQSEKEFLRLEADVLSRVLKDRKYKELEQDVLSSNLSNGGYSNGVRKKSSSGRDKWKCAVKKLRNPKKRKNVERKTSDETPDTRERRKMFARNFEDQTLFKEDGRAIATNWKAEDLEVWSVLEAEINRKVSITEEIIVRPTPRTRKLSLPASLDIYCNRVIPIIRKESSIEEIEENQATDVIIEEDDQDQPDVLEVPETDINATDYRSFYRQSVDSSLDSESGIRQEPKSFEVEVEINACPSLSSCDSPVREKQLEGGKSFCVCENDDVFGFDDDDDVITM